MTTDARQLSSHAAVRTSGSGFTALHFALPIDSNFAHSAVALASPRTGLHCIFNMGFDAIGALSSQGDGY